MSFMSRDRGSVDMVRGVPARYGAQSGGIRSLAADGRPLSVRMAPSVRDASDSDVIGTEKERNDSTPVSAAAALGDDRTRAQAVLQNEASSEAAAAGSSSIHQWPLPSSSSTRAPALTAARSAPSAFRNGSPRGTTTRPGRSMASNAGPHSSGTLVADR